MCGLFGVVAWERLGGTPWSNAERARFDACRDQLAHRGPDGAGTWAAPGVLLGHRRLAILDLTAHAAQPMVSRGGTALVFNGEIYNYVELRAQLGNHVLGSTGDTAVLLEALEAWGPQRTVRALRGMFAFAAFDPRSRHLVLARDHVGKKPLYHATVGGQTVFGSALAPVVAWLRAAGQALSLDPVAVEHFLASGYIPAPRTIWREVGKLPPATTLTIHMGSQVEERFHRVPFAHPGEPLDDAAEERLEALLSNAVTRRLRSDVPVATFLSGGLDSALVTALAARHHPGIVAYTVRTPGRNQDELEVARRVAAATCVEHRVLDVDLDALDRVDALIPMFGEPFGDSSALPQFLIAEAARREHTVVLTGDGGDEVHGGYRPARVFAARHHLHRWPLTAVSPLVRALPLPTSPGRRHRAAYVLRRALADGVTAHTTHARGYYDLAAALLTDPARDAVGDDTFVARLARRWAAFDAHSDLDRHLGLDYTLYLPEDLCPKVDVATMAVALEARSPLLDIDFVDACWGIAAAHRTTPRESKRIVRRLLARVLPPDCVLGRKQGFSIPFDRWMHEPAVEAELLDTWRAGPPLLDGVVDGGAVVDAIVARSAAGWQDGPLRWRLLWLARWARWAASATAE